eukprot:CAMPEP_0182487300 /NCGR_PEP_ID=MMETSP1319-20130603/47833_1 /TAXON_ID=172717 /ORGANISM="Bolidomonas pacifica, Strain RCC208" /LENGTH=612 /DNA_ID=CAMNT_0024689417 /DNA_START=44 /DNA_END=1883 /DNA_ORIENTATION=-
MQFVLDSAQQMFGLRCVSLTYVDDEGERISMSSDIELLEAMRVCEECGRKSLKIRVAESDSLPRPPAALARAESIEERTIRASAVQAAREAREQAAREAERRARALQAAREADEEEERELRAALEEREREIREAEEEREREARAAEEEREREMREAQEEREREMREAQKEAEREAKEREREMREAQKEAEREAQEEAEREARDERNKREEEAARAAQLAEQTQALVDEEATLAALLEEESKGVVHDRVSCDSCGASPIQGVRYKCAVCSNYDLCSFCEDACVHDETHVFLKIRHPRQAPAALMVVLEEHQRTEAEATPDQVQSAIAIGADSDNWRQGMPAEVTLGDVVQGGTRYMRRQLRRERARRAREARKARKPDAENTTSNGEPDVATTEPVVVETAQPRSTKPKARFVCNVTVRDGTEVTPSTSFRKTWRLRNDAEVSWPEGTRLRPVGGDCMNGPLEGVPVLSISPGEELDITVELESPNAPGRYVGYWRLQTPEGTNFGHRVWVDVVVANERQAVPVFEEVVKPMPAAAPVEAEVSPPTYEEAAAAPVATAALVAAAVQRSQWYQEVRQLNDMGFLDFEASFLENLLTQNRGDVNAVVNHLLSAQW